MATLGITLGAQSKTVTISAPHLTRALAALRQKYGPIGANGSTRPMTDAETFDRWASEIVATLKVDVKTQEGNAAAQAAFAAVTDITLA